MPDDIEILKKIKEAEEATNVEFNEESGKLKEAYEQLLKKSQQDIEAEAQRLQLERRVKLDEEEMKLREKEENALKSARKLASEMKLNLGRKEASKILSEIVRKFLEE